MDCVADMVIHEGIQNMEKMTEAGMTLFPEHKPKFVRGQFPNDMGGGELCCLIEITSQES